MFGFAFSIFTWRLLISLRQQLSWRWQCSAKAFQSSMSWPATHLTDALAFALHTAMQMLNDSVDGCESVLEAEIILVVTSWGWDVATRGQKLSIKNVNFTDGELMVVLYHWRIQKGEREKKKNNRLSDLKGHAKGCYSVISLKQCADLGDPPEPHSWSSLPLPDLIRNTLVIPSPISSVSLSLVNVLSLFTGIAAMTV